MSKMLRTINTKQIDDIIEKYNRGEVLTRTENIFYQAQLGTLNTKIAFIYTDEELAEYIKCAESIEYFIEKYCGLKLRKYQLEWITAFNNNRFIINALSHQCGHSRIYSLMILHYMIFNVDKNISIISSKSNVSKEFINIVYQYYLTIPYFLKKSIQTRNANAIKFNNNCAIKTLGSVYVKSDILLYLDFAYIPSNILERYYLDSIVDITTNPDAKMIISSAPNGINKFYELVEDSQRKDGDPLKNVFTTIKTYWWEVNENRNQQWKEKTIAEVGGIDMFNQLFDIRFFKI